MKNPIKTPITAAVIAMMIVGGAATTVTAATASEEARAAQAAKISLKQAITIADDQVPGMLTSAEFDDDDINAQGGVYEIEFSSDSMSYEVKIDAMTGRVISSEKERLDRGDVKDYNTQQQAKVDMMAAISLAEKDTEGRVVEIEFKNDRDYTDHHHYYEVAVLKGDQMYELNVDADTGMVFDKAVDD